MSGAVAYLAPAVFLAFAGFRLTLSSGARTDPVQRAICGFAACSGLALLVNAPPTLRLLEPAVATEPVIWATRALKAYALTFLALLAVSLGGGDRLSSRRRARHHHLGALLFQSVAAVLFAAAGVRVVPDAVVVDGSVTLFVLYTALFVLYGVACLALLCRALLRRAEAVGPGRVRVGLSILTLAVAVGTVWTGWGLSDIASTAATGRQPLGEHPVATLLSAVTALLVLAGTTVTLWGGPLAAPGRHWRARRRHRALGPLWRALHAAAPEIALAPAPERLRPGWRTAEFALYRRVIEIHDGLLLLRPHFPLDDGPGTAAAERTGPGPDDPAADAARIARALENRRRGLAPGGPAGVPVPRPGGDTLEDEVTHLLRVTQAFTRAPGRPHREDPAGSRTGA
ncbi:MAB_1171c family putative transporter [Streptomyces bohaiensis]|uniref:DUF6545 domain-containing protein n=1 Tax=Streptomyces bohaiensis TaxID=1431344 RepID=A0ABX1CEJ1_9ACTN|nr:MAB_1171c family putative transporter [Streptomyces bohaiensis]NJQ16250.1 hypothetical protein [Streptomyces bohaiensis]